MAAVLEPVAKQGRGRAIVLTIYGACVALGVAFFAAGGVAVLAGQPPYVSRPLLLVGFVVAIPFIAGFMEMRKVYRQAELRKSVAADL